MANGVDASDRVGVVPSADLLHLCSNLKLCSWLSKFVCEVLKRGGEEYLPNSLYQMCVGIQRHLRDNGQAGLEIFKHPNFKIFQGFSRCYRFADALIDKKRCWGDNETSRADYVT